jgi:tRNA pseudouridine13 synthase
LRTTAADFEVEEIALYPPSGEGDHLFLWVEKVDVPAEALRRHVARAIGVPNMDVGMAGMKDRRAVTRQWLSVPRSAEGRLAAIDDDRIRVLNAVPHRHKLRTAHLAGNRFALVVRGVEPDALARIQVKLERLQHSGVPNLFGSQRMGQGGSTLAAGWALLRGSQRFVRVRTPDDTEHAVHLDDRNLRRLAASALQAEVFNRTLARRMAEARWRQVMDGDVCCKTISGGMFVTDDVAREQARLDAAEVELTGPMWGPKMMRSAGVAGELELAVLTELGIGEAEWSTLGHLAEGTRRPLAVRPGELSVSGAGDSVTVRFTLPAGAFATGVMHELMGPHPDLDVASDAGGAA